MRTELLGLELSMAEALLRQEGIVPEVTITAAPKAAGREGKLRVVSAGDGGRKLIAARFVDPIADAAAKE